MNDGGYGNSGKKGGAYEKAVHPADFIVHCSLLYFVDKVIVTTV